MATEYMFTQRKSDLTFAELLALEIFQRTEKDSLGESECRVNGMLMELIKCADRMMVLRRRGVKECRSLVK